MKKCNKPKKKRFFSILIKNYLLFTAVNILIIYFMVLGGSIITSKIIYYAYDAPEKQIDILKSGRYGELNVKKLVGKDGYIEVLDEYNNVIYRSKNSENNTTSYTDEELKYIFDQGDNQSDVSIEEYTDSNNKVFILINRNKYKEPDFDKNQGWFEVLDENLNVVYSGGNVEEEKKAYTKKEFDYLTGNSSSNYDIRKYSFENNDSKTYTLILKSSKLDKTKSLELMNKGEIIVVGIFVVIYIICTIIFVIALNRKVKKPLAKLNKAINSLGQGENSENIDYNGPYEFVQICDNFNNMAYKLRESNEKNKLIELEKQKMLADISHDLKTPITIIQGYAKALADGIISTDDQEKYLKIIYQKSVSLTELINIFYEYNKLEHGEFNLTLEERDLCEFVRAYIADKYEYIYDIGFNIDVEIPDNKLLCMIDEIQLKRAFENIIYNSIKHNKKGTTLGIFIEEEKENCKIIIADDGTGIPEEIAETIFDPFVVGDESRNSKQGSGLGLAITKKIIEKHKGSIKLISEPEGKFKTVFEILIPNNNKG
ncbi:MAG: HAMP domain-containing sensor histidine kinase [Clostridium sp.]|nr:HAMP domain-containing sensor histidine kinase [Clostridium sp.]